MPRIDIRGKNLLFDFDGTMVATEMLAKEVIDDYFVQKGWPGQVPFAEMIVGRTWKAATENMIAAAKDCGFQIDDADALMKEFKSRYRKRFELGVSLVPGLFEKLPELKAKSKFMGIVTGSEHDEVDRILDAHGLRPYFTKVWAYGDYPHSKPDPAPFLTAIKELQCTPADCFVFEDSQAGMESAQRAGIPWVQIAYEAHALQPHPHSVHVIQNWHELELI